jgi:2'-5' RNA ligase
LNPIAELGPEGVRRAFIAIPAPPCLRADLAAGLREWCELGADVRWTVPTRAHLTLRFLGPANRRAVETLDLGLRPIAAVTAPITLRPQATGAFPGWRRPRILWLGLEARGLASLAQAIEEAARAAGFAPEDREFTPHLTLGRVRRPGGLGRATEAVRGWRPRGTPETVGEIVLYASDLGAGGPSYSSIETYALTGGLTT